MVGRRLAGLSYAGSSHHAQVDPHRDDSCYGRCGDAAQTYGRRWPAQENIIRDYLLALGLDTNRGYAKTAVVNSEVAKRRTALEQRLATLRSWTESARVRYQHATALSDRLRKQAKARGETLYRGLNERMFALEEASAKPRLMLNCKGCGNVSTGSRPGKTRIGASRNETLASSVRCCGHWRTWPARNGRCLSWTIAKIRS